MLLAVYLRTLITIYEWKLFQSRSSLSLSHTHKHLGFTLGAIRTLLFTLLELGVEELWVCGGVARDMGLEEGRKSDWPRGSWIGTRYESVRGRRGFIFLSEGEVNNCKKHPETHPHSLNQPNTHLYHLRQVLLSSPPEDLSSVATGRKRLCLHLYKMWHSK